MKIRLEFEGRESNLRLRRVALWEKADDEQAPPASELLAAALAANRWSGGRVFQWRSSIRAFCLLLLRAYVAGKPFQGSLTGGRASAARSLVELLGDKKKKDGEPTWAQLLFVPPKEKDETHRRVPPSVFVHSGNSDADHFDVMLGTAWRGADLEVLWDSAAVADKDVARQLALAIEAQLEKGLGGPRLTRLTGAVDLLVWEPRRGELLPAEKCCLPVPLDSGLALRIRLERLAHAYVIWINSAGRVQPMYPWKNLDWNAAVKSFPIAELALPDAQLDQATGFYPLEGTAGVETAVLLACDAPAPPLVQRRLKAAVEEIAPKFHPTLPDKRRVYFLTDPRPRRTGQLAFRLGKPQATDDPLSGLAERILHHVGPDFPCIAGVSFCTAGRR